jgi:hypothetical protein
MNQQITISLKSHLRNLKHIIGSVIFGLAISILIYNFDYDKLVFIIFGILYFCLLIPVILIHLDYYKIDSNKTIAISNNNESIEIFGLDNNVKIKQTDIEYVIMTTGINSRLSIWSGYYYYQLKLCNGQVYYLTSLLINSKDFPFSINTKRQKSFPFVKYFYNEKYKQALKEMKVEEFNSKIDFFYDRFADHTIDELNEIVENKKSYEGAAVRAAEKLIKEKITVANTYKANKGLSGN